MGNPLVPFLRRPTKHPVGIRTLAVVRSPRYRTTTAQLLAGHAPRVEPITGYFEPLPPATVLAQALAWDQFHRQSLLR
jgi:hypothetical protein